ncbi:hypothetical protein Ae168Ps1_1577c [Pseudonocardia sp. Ae168_Ps1]|nr:hypothetical protein Ae168Ps1_1577c [Pseudonocardia sp. Ae168_Ps1]OLL86692.1 hypothetical protein Ae263Ps1_3747 [Pseudonocardia sp. Ae263_Ps1]OLL93262.1 hypothetical protein Ae356Ps1_3159c [Pseudonocardia sp. Ae356_Ps1]
MKPAPVSRSRHRSGSPRESGLAPSGGGSGSRRAPCTAHNHSCSASGCHTCSTIRPPGASARCRFAKAASGSPKNMTPLRLPTTSNAPSPSSSVWASATAKVAGSPDAAARSRAIASIAADMSTPCACPSGAAADAASRVVVPAPQPTSSTRSPGRTAVADRNASR